MAKKLYEEAAVQDIAAAIREKTGGAETYKIAQMGNAVRGITCAESIAWHQCPEAVRNYLTNVTYDPNDYSTSQIANYAPASAVVSNHKPIGQTAGGTVHYNEVPNVLTPFASGGKAARLNRWTHCDGFARGTTLQMHGMCATLAVGLVMAELLSMVR